MKSAIRKRSNLKTIWKVLVTALICSVITVEILARDVVLPPKPTDAEKQLVSTVENAINTTNIAVLIALDYSPADKSSAAANAMFYQSMIERGCVKLTLKRTDPAKETEHISPIGDLYRENLPVRWILTVVHPSQFAGGEEKTEFRAGLFENKIRFTQSERLPDKKSDK